MRYVAKHNKGFTLIELLIVMAISVILMGLVLYPVYESFQITRMAQAMVDSQDAARTAMQTISRELGQGMFVFDNAQGQAYLSDSSYSFDNFMTGVPSAPTRPQDVQSPIMLPVAQPNSADPTGDGSTQWFVLPYGKIDFILPKLYMHCNNPDHPANAPRDYPRDVQDSPNHRELRDWPECPYCRDSDLVSTDVEARPKTPLEQDTTVVRYFLALARNDLGVKPPSTAPANAGWVSPWGKNVIDGTQNQVILYRAEFDPHDDTLFPADMPLAQRLNDPFFFYRTNYRSRWMSISRVVGIGKYEDLVTATFDGAGNVLTVQPTITFRMASIENDTFAPAYDTDKQNDYPGAPANVYAASYGYWTPGSRIEVMRGNFINDKSAPPGSVDYYTGIDLGDLVIFRQLPGDDPSVEFNISEYRRNGYVAPPAAGSDKLEMAFDIDDNKGTVNFALQPVREKPDPKAQFPPTSGPVCTFDPATINGDFKTAYLTDRYGARRTVLVASMDSTNTDQYLAHARIVPGSDKVIGPDMMAGPHFGLPVRYERIPLGLRYPAQNQYQVDCDTGRIMFSPDPNLDLPETYKDSAGKTAPTSIEVYYLVYFNQTDDVIRGDYLTKSLINVQLGMRMFDPDKGKPYPVDLTNSVKVRNALR